MKMRKVLSALLVAACTLSLAACGSSSSKNETRTNPSHKRL